VLTISRPVNGGTMIGISFTTPQAMSDVENV